MNKKIACIKRLIDNNRFYEFTEWLTEHKLMAKDDAVELTRNQEKAEFVYTTLKKAEKDDKLILLDFEWTILPLETIKITCITETTHKEFTYGVGFTKG